VIPWFHVTCSPEALHLDVRPPRRPPWQAAIPWETVERVCLKRGDLWQSDEVYLFVRGRKASYRIPLDCAGGEGLVEALLARRLADAEAWVDTLSGRGAALRCWPPA